MDPQKFNNTKRLSRDTGYVRPKKTYQFVKIKFGSFRSGKSKS